MSRLIVCVLIAFSASCSRSEDKAEEAPLAPALAAGEIVAVASSAAARWVPVRAAKDASMLSAPGIVRAEASASGQVSTTFRGQVTKVHVRVGDRVAQGQAIVDLSAPEVVSAAANYVGLGNRLKVHRERLRALGELRKEGMVRTSVVFEQEALVAELSAEMRKAAAILKMAQLGPKDAGRIAQNSRITLVAPVDGVVSSISGHPGEVLDGATAFAHIIGPGVPRIEVTSPTALTVGETLTMRLGDGRSYQLSPTPVSSIVEADTGMHQSWFALVDSTVQLGDGMRCTVEFHVSDNVWEAPVGAVATTSNGSVVWRRRKGVVERISVQVLRASGASVLIQGTFEAGDELSADGTAAMGGQP